MIFTNPKKREERINLTRQNTIRALITAQLDYYKLNHKNITHAASQRGRERERERERETLRSTKKERVWSIAAL